MWKFALPVTSMLRLLASSSPSSSTSLRTHTFSFCHQGVRRRPNTPNTSSKLWLQQTCERCLTMFIWTTSLKLRSNWPISPVSKSSKCMPRMPRWVLIWSWTNQRWASGHVTSCPPITAHLVIDHAPVAVHLAKLGLHLILNTGAKLADVSNLIKWSLVSTI